MSIAFSSSGNEVNEYDRFISIPHGNGVFAWYKDYPSICCTASNDMLAYIKLKEYRKAYLKLAKKDMEFIFESELERQNTPHEHFVTVIKPTKTIVLGESILEHLCASIGEQVCPVTIVASNGDKTVGFYKTRYNNGYNLRRHSETSLCFSSVVTVNAILKLHKKEVADDDYSGHRFTNIKFVDMNIRGNTEKVALIL